MDSRRRTKSGGCKKAVVIMAAVGVMAAALIYTATSFQQPASRQSTSKSTPSLYDAPSILRQSASAVSSISKQAAKKLAQPLLALRKTAECEGWRQTGDCGNGDREPQNDKKCNQEVPSGHSGYCECCRSAGARLKYGCEHGPFKCTDVCKQDRVVQQICADLTEVPDSAANNLPSAAVDNGSDKPVTVEQPKWTEETPVQLIIKQMETYTAPAHQHIRPAEFLEMHPYFHGTEDCQKESGFAELSSYSHKDSSHWWDVCSGGKISWLRCSAKTPCPHGSKHNHHQPDQYICQGAGFRFTTVDGSKGKKWEIEGDCNWKGADPSKKLRWAEGEMVFFDRFARALKFPKYKKGSAVANGLPEHRVMLLGQLSDTWNVFEVRLTLPAAEPQLRNFTVVLSEFGAAFNEFCNSRGVECIASNLAVCAHVYSRLRSERVRP